VQVADSTRLGAAASVVRAAISSGAILVPREYRSRPVVARKVAYSFQQLSNWRDLVVDSLLMAGDAVIMDDLDEMKNRIVVGLNGTLEGASGQVGTRLTALNIPVAAVQFVQASLTASPAAPAQPMLLSSDSIWRKNDTIAGGFQIGIRSPGGVCTNGLVVDRSGTRGMITASHCTAHLWQADTTDTLWFASASTGEVAIGRETVDPAGISCSGIYSGCTNFRASDASFFTAFTYPSRRGSIVRTQGRVSGSAGTLAIDTSNPWINMNTDSPLIFAGLQVNKVGKATGWTYGNVTNTCQDATMSDGGSNHRVLCEDVATVWVHSGDSGGPIFTWDGEDGGSFLGLLTQFGNGCGDPCTTISFTPLSNIVNDLGSLTVSAQITVGTPSVTLSINGSNQPLLSWSAVSTSGTTKTTEYKIYRAIWDASTYTWTDLGSQIGSVTTTSFYDTSLPFAPAAATGTSKPADCTYSQASYWVVAYNAGIAAGSVVQYIQGPADGTNPDGHECQ
jgi:hypothetical protein